MNTPHDGVPVPQRYWAIATVALTISLSVLDGAIANVALPAIANDLHASPAASIWVINAYQLAVVVSLLALASLGDFFGYRRVYQCGLALFSVTSLLCALAGSLPTLTLARAAQGFGAAGIMSVNTALIRIIYPREHLGRGMALNALVVALSSAAGPTLAAGILSIAPWQWLFAINVPLGVAAFFIGLKTLPDNPAKTAGRFDSLSALLNALTFGALIVCVDGFGHHANPLELGALLLFTAVVGTLFVRRQMTLPSPLLPLDLLRIPVFGLSIATSITSFCAQMLAMVAIPFYLQSQLGMSAAETGLLLTPWPLAIVVVAPLAGRLVEHGHSPGLLGGIGLSIFALGLALLGTLPAHPLPGDIAWRMAVCGIGFGFFQSPNNFAMLSAAPPQRSGGASGMLGTARLLGQTTGAAMVALFLSLFGIAGTRDCLLVAAAISVCAAAVSCLRIGSRTQAAGKKVSEAARA
ncbi:MAG: MFS transporter [Paludibacterium sp.]|uniref:MFS transporter n=1 Tax=Paludibacterium sp. TaxID=1917523 RepID=UPI0025E98AAC|nr:MFS transporter [Paludibacterium sp.]MBV8046586.1 MFS transporter [Paludibacterium sp.]MBV8647758.1 MFS transporter [Paludibacterium sp.]